MLEIQIFSYERLIHKPLDNVSELSKGELYTPAELTDATHESGRQMMRNEPLSVWPRLSLQ